MSPRVAAGAAFLVLAVGLASLVLATEPRSGSSAAGDPLAAREATKSLPGTHSYAVLWTGEVRGWHDPCG